jgi:fructose-1,6-bisphosphatase/inositol monophosphatase family enzyme
MVSEADRGGETLGREALAAEYPSDGIVGEEQSPSAGSSGFSWVIDPIDGTANSARDARRLQPFDLFRAESESRQHVRRA